MRFSILGNPNSNIAMPICESLIQGLQCHIEKVVNEPPKKDNIDYIGEITFLEHKRNAEFAAKKLYQLAADDTLPDCNDMISFYFIALEYDLANSVYNTRHELGKFLIIYLLFRKRTHLD